MQSQTIKSTKTIKIEDWDELTSGRYSDLEFYRDVYADSISQYPVIKNRKTHQTVARVIGGGSMEEATRIADLMAVSGNLLKALKYLLASMAKKKDSNSALFAILYADQIIKDLEESNE